MAQLVRAPPCHGGGRRFESDLGRQLFYDKITCGVLAQLGEHLPYKQRVTGSSPVGPILHHDGAGYFADVAQLAEQLICNQQVIGSSPIVGFGIKKISYRLLGPLAQLVRAPPCHGGGRGFESLLGRF